MSDLSPRSHGWRVALRLASRTARRTLGRTILVGALIALPVIGVAAFATVYASTWETVTERVSIDLGHAEGALQVVGQPGQITEQAPTDIDMFMSSSNEGGPNWVSDVSPLLPEGTRVLPIRSMQVTATTATGIGSMEASVGESWDPSLEGRFLMGEGRRPANDTEAMVSTSALVRLGISLGDSVRITQPHAADYTVVGTLQSARQATTVDALFLPPAYDETPLTPDTAYFYTFYLPDYSLTWPQILELNAHGVVAMSREVALDPPSGDFISNDGTGGTVVAGLIVLGFALIEVGLLAAAAFTVGARQQQRTLAVLASVGADRRTVARVVSLNGLVIGISGAAIGVALGIGLAAIIIAATADGSRTQYPGFHLQPTWLGGIALLAVVAAWIAAMVPARAASRLDVVAALRGATRPPKPRKRTPVIAIIIFVFGLVLVTVGLVVVGTAGAQNAALSTIEFPDEAEWKRIRLLSTIGITLLSVGPVVAQIAAIVIAPAIFRVVARALARLSVGTRLASRDAARNAARTVPAASVVMSTVFLSAFLMCLLAGTQKAADDNYQPVFAEGQVGVSLIEGQMDGTQTVADDPLPFVDALESSFDTSKVRVLHSVRAEDGLSPMPVLAPDKQCGLEDSNDQRCVNQPYFYSGYTTGAYDQKIWVGSEADLALILGAPLTEESKATLRAGGTVTPYKEFLDDGTATIAWWDSTGDMGYLPGETADHQKALPASYQVTPHPGSFALLMTPATADSIGLDYDPTLALAATATPVTQAQEDSGRAAIEALTNGSGYIEVERGPQEFAQWAWLVLAISSVIMLAAASVAIGLARSDGRRDDAVLGAVGASPGLRRSFGFWQAIVICGTGSVIGAVLGFAEYAALAGATLVDSSIGIPFAVPVLPLLATVIAVPLLIAAGSWLTARPGRTHVMDRSAIA